MHQSHGESPAHLLRYGLARALQLHSEELRVRHPHVSLDLDLVDDEGLLGDQTCRVLFRLYQETLANIDRHAVKSAGRDPVHVWVRYAPSGGSMALEIRDDGRGFSISDDWARFAAAASGVMGMKKHIEALGGSLLVTAENGARILATVPIAPAKPDPQPGQME